MTELIPGSAWTRKGGRQEVEFIGIARVAAGMQDGMHDYVLYAELDGTLMVCRRVEFFSCFERVKPALTPREARIAELEGLGWEYDAPRNTWRAPGCTTWMCVELFDPTFERSP